MLRKTFNNSLKEIIFKCGPLKMIFSCRMSVWVCKQRPVHLTLHLTHTYTVTHCYDTESKIAGHQKTRSKVYDCLFVIDMNIFFNRNVTLLQLLLVINFALSC